MKCLNPIIAFNNPTYCNVDLYTGEKIKSKKSFFTGMHNFRDFCNTYGNDYALRILHDKNAILLPCRKCINCQLNRSREWAVRNSLEALSYDDESKIFLTLTYRDGAYHKFADKVPTLSVAHLQGFIKRLRKEYSNRKIRFYACGEYGSMTLRPHYHILIYGLPKKDIIDLDYKYSYNNNKYYDSKKIYELWSFGNIIISDFSNYTAMYTARYCTKKVDHNDKILHNYCFTNSEKEKFQFEFNTMSRRPGIAYDYYISQKNEIYKNDKLLFHLDEKTIPLKPFNYFDRLYDVENPHEYQFIKENRRQFSEAWRYFEELETNLNFSEYLQNEERIQKSKFSRKENIKEV